MIFPRMNFVRSRLLQWFSELMPAFVAGIFFCPYLMIKTDKPIILMIGAGIIALVSFAGGFAVEHWRQGAEVEKLAGEKLLLVAAGDKCAADIENARSSMYSLAKELEERKEQAEEAMRRAEPGVQERIVTITKIKALPQVEAESQCEAIRT